jgi:hypothetical protein
MTVVGYPRNLKASVNITTMDHKTIDQLNLEYHRLIAKKLREQPSLFDKVVEELRITIGEFNPIDAHPAGCEEWLELLENQSKSVILNLMCDPNENSTRLRQSSPFGGIMTQEERTEIRKRVLKN